ncbi:hypothetical protein V492_01980, partial [Pseudogymnoascus sp. VKM F-4246]
MSEAMYAPPLPSSFRHPSKKKVEIKWGSDAGFTTGQRFVAPPNTITLDEIDESIASTLECLQPGSNVSTRPSSPTGSKHPHPHHDNRRLEMITESTRDDGEDGSERPKKRKKNKGKEGIYESPDAAEQAQLQTPNSKPRKRRPKSFGAAGGGGDSGTPNRASPPLHKRLKPTTTSGSGGGSGGGGGGMSGTPKMARENLTEDQKRENHIKSEQKRRTLIKEGF